MTFETFVTSICADCGNCDKSKLILLGTCLCYEMYSKDKKKFNDYILPKLSNLMFWPYNLYEERTAFVNIFCKSGICGKKKKKVKKCKDYNKCKIDFIDCLVDDLLDDFDIYDNLLSPNTQYNLASGYDHSALDKHCYVEPTPKITVIYGGTDDWVNKVKTLGKKDTS